MKGDKRVRKNTLGKTLISILIVIVMISTIYVAEPNTTKSAINTIGNTSQNINEGGLIAKQGDWIYFANAMDDEKLYKMRLDGSEMTLIHGDDHVDYINVIGDWVYYRNDSNIFKIKIDGTGNKRITDESTANIFVIGNVIYYNSYSGQKISINKINSDGTKRTKIADVKSEAFTIEGDWIYYVDGYNLVKIKTDGTKKTTILKDSMPFHINVVGEWIYFTNYKDGAKLYKIKSDGKGKQKLNNLRTQGIYVIGDWVYYQAQEHTGLFRVKTNGTNNEKPVKLSDINRINVIDDWIYGWDIWHRPFRMKLDLSSKQRIDGLAIDKPADNTKEILASGINKQGNTSANINNSPFAAEQGGWVYYNTDNKGNILTREKLDGSNKTYMTFVNHSYYVNAAGGYLYYNNGFGIARCKLNGENEEQITDDNGSTLTVIGDWIYYTAWDENGEKLHRVKIDGKNKTLLSKDEIVENYFIDGDWIYYHNGNESGYPMYKVKLDGTGRAKVNRYYHKKMIVNNNTIYYIYGYQSPENGKLYKSNLDGSNSEKISDDTAEYFNIQGDWIYYTNTKDNNKLYKIKLDGSEKTKMTDTPAYAPCIIGDWIFYYGNTYKYGIDTYDEKYKIKLDGTSNEKL